MAKKTPQLIDFFNGGLSPFASKAPVPQTGMNLRAGPLNNGNKFPVPNMNTGSLASILSSPNPNMSVGTSKKSVPAKATPAPKVVSPSRLPNSPLNPVLQTTSNNADLSSIQQKLQARTSPSIFNTQESEQVQNSVPPEWINPKGGFYTPDEVAVNRAKSIPQMPEGGDIGRYSAGQFGDQNMTTLDAMNKATDLNNARNDIAVGETDPYGLIDPDLQFNAQEIQAIRSAQAGIYDPALSSALSKLEVRQQRDIQKEASDQRMRELQLQAENDLNAPYTLGKDQVRYDGQGNPIAIGITDEVTAPTSYTPGQDATVDAYVKQINENKMKIGDVREEYRDAVAQGLAKTLPPVSPTAKKLSGVISKILEYDEGQLDDISGFWKVPGSIAGVIPLDGTTAAKIKTLTKQLQGTLAVKDRGAFTGQGAISDFEFRVLQQAASDLGIKEDGSTSLPVKDFVQRITDMKTLLDVGETGLPDDEVLLLHSQGATPEEIRQLGVQQSFSNVGNTTASKTSLNRPQRNKNPGNVKKGGLADSLAVGTDDQGHLIFPDPETGFKALVMDVTAKINGASRYLPQNPTIAQLGKVYAEDPNWPKSVSRILGVSPTTPTKSVPINKLVQAIATQEGFYS